MWTIKHNVKLFFFPVTPVLCSQVLKKRSSPNLDELSQNKSTKIEKVFQTTLFVYDFSDQFYKMLYIYQQNNRLNPGDNEVSTWSNEYSFSSHFNPNQQLVYVERTAERKVHRTTGLQYSLSKYRQIQRNQFCLKYILYGLKNHSK